MRLIRRLDLPHYVKTIHRGPCPGGTFWALEGTEDFSLIGVPVAYADPAYLMKHGTLYLQDARNPDHWQVVSHVAVLRKFTTVWREDEDGRPYCVVHPFLPEFYYVPRTARGARAVARAERRATSFRRRASS